jgi:hypothetical protein
MSLTLRSQSSARSSQAGSAASSFRVMLEVRPAAAGVGDDGVELVRRHLLHILAGQLLGQSPLAVVRVQRPATLLVRRRDDLAAVSRQHFGRVPVDIAEDDVLGAAGEQGDAIPGFSAG